MAVTDSISSSTGRSYMPRGMPTTPELIGKLPVPVLLYLLTVMIPVLFNVGPLAMSLQRLMLLVITVPLLIKIFSGKYGKVLAVDILFVLHIAWAALAIAVLNPDQVIQQIGSVGMEFLGGYAVGRAFIRTKEDFVALCKILVVLVCCTTPFAVYETFTDRPILVEMIWKLPGVRSVGVVFAPDRMGFERVQAVFAHPIHYGLFCSVAFSLCFVALEGLVSTGKRILLSSVVLMSGFLALSSGALLALVLQIFLIAWSMIFANVKQRWWILLGLFALAYVVIDLLSNRTPIKVFMSYATFSAHNAYWRGIIFDWGMRNILGDPAEGIPRSIMFGIGLNDWIRPHFMTSGSMDNFWLVMGVRYGAPGFVLVAAGYIVGVAKIMRRDFSSDLRMTLFRRAWVFTFLGLSFTLCTVHVWTALYSFVFFMFGAGMWMIHHQTDAADEMTPDTSASNSRSDVTTTRRSQQPQNDRTAKTSLTRPASAQTAPASVRAEQAGMARPKTAASLTQKASGSRTSRRTSGPDKPRSQSDAPQFSRFTPPSSRK